MNNNEQFICDRNDGGMIQMTGTNGFAITIAVPSGEPDGLRVIEKSNWDGKGLIFPRAHAQYVSTERELAKCWSLHLVGPQRIHSVAACLRRGVR